MAASQLPCVGVKMNTKRLKSPERLFFSEAQMRTCLYWDYICTTGNASVACFINLCQMVVICLQALAGLLVDH